MDELAPLVGTPEKLVVSGSSAGGFGAALLADHIADRFSATDNMTVVVDSSLLLYDGWKDVAVEIWQSPPAIAEELYSDNITLDALRAAQAAHPAMKVLFASSTRDSALVQYQSYLDGGAFEASADGGRNYQKNLKAMVDKLGSSLDNSGVYIFEGVKDDKTELTQHTVLVSNAFDPLSDSVSAAEWIYQAVNGKVSSYGTGLL
jgi:acetyl esterase/lipase